MEKAKGIVMFNNVDDRETELVLAIADNAFGPGADGLITIGNHRYYVNPVLNVVREILTKSFEEM